MLLTIRANSSQATQCMQRPCERAPRISPTRSTIQDPACSPNAITPMPVLSPAIISIRGLKQHHDRKSHPHDRSTNSHIHLSNPALGAREMARSWLNTRITWERGRSAASGSIRRARAFAAVVVTGGRVISRDRSRRETMSGYSRGCSRCGCGSSGGFG